MGANAVILGPVILGDNTIVGACALVTSSFEGNGTLIGVPAKQLYDVAQLKYRTNCIFHF